MAGATADELRRKLRRGEPFTDDETATAELLLELAMGVIEEETGQPLLSSTDTVTLDGPSPDERPHEIGTGVTKLVLPRWPVTAVASLTLTDTDALLIEGLQADYTWSAAGVVTRRGGWWPSHERAIDAVYTAGFLQLPTGVKAIQLRLAADGWANPERLASESLGDHSRSYAAEALGLELTAAERRTLRAYRART